MLRISGAQVAAGETRLRLDGKLVGPWVSELRLLCEPILEEGQRIEIDCSGVSSIDSAGIELMQMLQRKGVVLVKCSPFIELQLRQDRTSPTQPRQ
jgi:ABC-type transporter Mla MlaB component